MSSVEDEALSQRVRELRAKAMHVRELVSQIGHPGATADLLHYAATLDEQAAALEAEATALREAAEAAIRHADEIANQVAQTRRTIDQLRDDLSKEPDNPDD